MNRLRNILLCICAILYSTAVYSQVVINQIMYDTPYNEQIAIGEAYSNGEFVELYNVGDTAVSLSGWTLCGDGKTEIFAFDNVQLPPNGYLAVAYRHKQTPEFALDSIYPMSGKDATQQIIYQRKIVLNNSGERICLRDAVGNIADSIYYDGNSNKRKPDRLSADNQDSIPYTECRSLQRLHVYMAGSRALSRNSDWETGNVGLFKTIPAVIYGADMNTYENMSIPHDVSYIVQVEPLDKTDVVLCNADKIQIGNNARAKINITCYDGLGRGVQNYAVSNSPQGKDIVTMAEYDGVSEKYRVWNPIAIEHSSVLLENETLRATAATAYDDPYPFTETIYEPNALHRIAGYKKQGTTVQAHPIRMEYLCNEDNDVLRLEVKNDSIITGKGYYDIWTLLKNTTTDEDGHSIDIYTDIIGRTILRKQESTYTYYVYNEMGRLYAVLPLASNNLPKEEMAESDDWLRKFAYIYHYDNRGNQSYKRLPGCEPVYMIYDQSNRLVLQQDGNQRQRGNYWLGYKYDANNHVAYTTEISISNRTYTELAHDLENKVLTEQFSTTRALQPMEDTGYSCDFLQDESKLLCVYYYDTYDFLQWLPDHIKNELTYEEKAGYDKQHSTARGLLTGKRVYSLTENNYTATAYYYDEQGRVIQTHSYSLNQTDEHTFIALNHDGTPSKSLSMHGGFEEKYMYAYDAQGRLQKTLYQIGDNNAVVLKRNTYNEIGQPVEKRRHNGQDSITYRYNIQGQLTQLRNGDYTEDIYYADSLPQYTAPHYNGNISAIKIQHTDSTTLNLSYHYDAYGRLTSTGYLPNTMHSAIGRPFLLFCEKAEYDHLGNILHLERYNNGRKTDDLDYEYDGNQVVSVVDLADSKDRYNTFEYTDISSYIGAKDEKITYDSNGNMTSDNNRGISAIRYNLLNLPDTIQFAEGGQIINVYSAEGIKYRTEYIIPKKSILLPLGTIAHYTIDTIQSDRVEILYDGNWEQRRIHLDSWGDRFNTLTVYNSEGYTKYKAANGEMTNPQMYYYRKDHLGNNVSVWNATKDTTEQRTFYYPSGVPMEMSTGQGLQQKKYNGKEFISTLGYNRYDYGFRHYDATIGRFNTCDPMTELTPWQSPYVYADNNPTNRTDAMGLMGTRRIKDVWQYTEIDDDGFVTLHIDNDDERVFVIMENGERKEIGTEWDKETYTEGERAYIRRNSGGIRMYYKYSLGISVSPDTPFEDRVGRWLRAKRADKMEEELLEKARPIVQGLVLFIPILSQYNDLKTLATGENIYGTKAADIDRILSFVNLYSLGAERFVMLPQAKKGLEIVEKWCGRFSVGKTIRDEQKKSGENY